MEPNAPVATPLSDQSKQGKGKGLVVATVVASVVAVCGIGFGIYGMIQSFQKDSQIANLMTQMQDDSGATNDTQKLEDISTTQTTKIVETAIDEENSVSWPEGTERLDGEPEILVNKIVLPKITIDSETAQLINDEIVSKYSIYLEDEQNYAKGPYEVETTYDSIVRDDILYLVIRNTIYSYRATGSGGLDVYYYDIANDTKLSVQEVAARYNIPEKATIIVPSVANSFDYYYRDDNYCYRLGCEVIDNTL